MVYYQIIDLQYNQFDFLKSLHLLIFKYLMNSLDDYKSVEYLGYTDITKIILTLHVAFKIFVTRSV